MQNKIIWACSTRHHHWRHDGFPSLFLKAASDAGIAGPLEWYEGWGPQKPRPLRVEDPEEAGRRLVELVPESEQDFYMSGGGSIPQEWKAAFVFPYFPLEDEELAGCNDISVLFDGTPFLNPEGSDRLLQAFRALHSDMNTGYACIHPYDHYEDLREAKYRRPVYTHSALGGIYWANFLGTEVMRLFDSSKLVGLPGSMIERPSAESLFLITGSDISQATSAESEAEIIRLTEIFRTARIPKNA